MIFITGATGFVGSHLVRAFSAAGKKVRALSRDAASASGIAGLPDVEVVYGDVGRPASLLEACRGCTSAIHLVGIIQEGPGYTFQSVVVDGTRNVIEAAKEAGTVRHFVYQSALGTRAGASTEYYRTKYAAEEMTKSCGLDYTITRPSVIFGKGDGFTRRLAQVVRAGPVIPVTGSGKVLMQPVSIGDVAQAFLKVVENPYWFGKTLAICGPEKLSLDEIYREIAAALNIKKPLVHVPMFMMMPAAALMESLLPAPPVTRDQLLMLLEDNVCEANTFKEMGITPKLFRDGLRTFAP